MATIRSQPPPPPPPPPSFGPITYRLPLYWSFARRRQPASLNKKDMLTWYLTTLAMHQTLPRVGPEDSVAMAKYASSAAVEIVKPEFMQTIRSKSLTRLKIPPKFYAEYLGESHQNVTVTLISDQLSCPWTVTLEGQTLRDSWPLFAKALRLKVSDCVVFRYKGNYVFRVTAFGADGEKLEHEHCEQAEGAIHGGNVSSGKGKGKQVERHHGDYAKSQRNATHGGENFGNSARSQRIGSDGDASLTSKGTRSHKNVAVEEISSFVQIVTESNIERNEVYMPRKFLDLNCLDEKDLDCIILTNNDGDTWEAVGKACTDRSLRITGCWSMFCYENDLAPGDCCKFQLVENTEHIVLKLVGPTEDVEVEPFSPGGRGQYSSGSGLRIPKVEGSSMYSVGPARRESGQMRRK